MTEQLSTSKHLLERRMLAAWLSLGRLESMGCCLLQDAGVGPVSCAELSHTSSSKQDIHRDERKQQAARRSSRGAGKTLCTLTFAACQPSKAATIRR